MKAIADSFVKYKHYEAAITIYEVLVAEIIEYFNDYRDEYIAFSAILTSCIGGIDSCFVDKEDNQKIWQHALQAHFALYRFYVDSQIDLDENIPGLLVGNTTPEECRLTANWVRSSASEAGEANLGNSQRLKYDALLRGLEK